MKKRLSELAALRFRMLLLFAAVFIAICYLAFALFKFNGIASAIINNYKPDDDDGNEPGEEEEEDDDDKQKEQSSANVNGQAKQPQTEPA